MRYISLFDKKVRRMGLVGAQHQSLALKFEINWFFLEVTVLYWNFYMDW